MVLCPICNNILDQRKYLKTYTFDFFKDHYKQEYKLYQCSSCYLQFWNPLKFVPEFYKTYLPKDEITTMGFRELSPYAEFFFKLLPVKSGYLLDIGCGDGVFLQHAKKLGFNTFGIDLDEKCIDAAIEHRGLENVYTLLLDEYVNAANKSNQQFNIISFFEVLEHQDNPNDFICNIKRLLNNGGYVIGSVPNRERFLSKLDWEIFMGDFPPPHLTRWSKEVLESFLRKEGFNNIECYSVGFKHKEQLASWYKTVLLRGIPSRLISMFTQNGTKSTSGTAFNEGINNSEGRLNKLRSKSNILFMPLASATMGLFNKRGTHIYFQAKYSGGLS